MLFGAAAAASAHPDPSALLVWGDSLSSAFGIPVEAGWVKLLQKRLEEKGYPYVVVNGSVTGETTAGGRARLPDALHRHRPAIVLIELGGNDGLRGLPVKDLRDNLTAMVKLSRRSGARVAVFAMEMPPNYGQTYRTAYQKAFGAVARQQHATLVPFLLAPLLQHQELFQEDGIHPRAEGQPKILDAVWPSLVPLLDQTSGKAAPSPKAPVRATAGGS